VAKRGGVLMSRFRRLYELSIDSNTFVVDMQKASWEVGGVGWRWKHE